MADLDEYIAESENESDMESCIDDNVVDGVNLPNFKVLQSLNTQLALDIIDHNLPCQLNYRGYVPFRNFKFGFDEIELSVMVDLQDETHPMSCHIENYKLSRKIVDVIRVSLREYLAEEIQQHKGNLTILTSGLIVLRLLEQTAGYVAEYRSSIASNVNKEKYWDLHRTKNINPLLDPKLEMLGVDMDTVQGAANHILGKTPAQICDDILPDWRTLHCENILRRDLQVKFLQYQQELREKLMRKRIEDLRTCVPREHRRTRGGQSVAKEQLVDYLVKPQITFHGTRRSTIPSIVQHGFLKPGDVHPMTKKPLPIYNGSAYGQGIYSSPKPWYALMYSESGHATKPSELPGLKLIICATIMGRPAKMQHEDEWQSKSDSYPGSDSHVNDSELAYIVFNSAQILPCYVLHLDWADRTDEEIHDYLTQFTNPNTRKAKNKWAEEPLMPGDIQRLKQERMARAKKYFAYGFGPISGRNIVVEDIAEIDDDEEDYGEFQANRIDGDEQTNTNVWEWGKLEGETEFDEYASARKAKINRRNPVKSEGDE